ncbi:MAG: efflux RND transporter periplasmic adaptor subunit [Planctomycetaceae bacterium]
MNRPNLNIPSSAVRWIVTLTILAVAGLTWSRWWPPLQQWAATATGRMRQAPAISVQDQSGDEHDGHDHAAHAATDSIEVSVQARKNLGLTAEYLRPVTRSTYRRSIRVPAVIVEQPGRTRVQVSTPMTAIVTRIHVTSGQSVQAGQLMFSLRLTHEDLVSSQTEFLKTLGELDVERKEFARLREIPAGTIPQSQLLQRQYQVEKLESRLAADREALKLHGLNDEQVRRIESDRTLLRTLEIYAPREEAARDSEFRLTVMPFETVSLWDEPEDGAAAPAPTEPSARTLVLEELRVHQGQAVNAGEALGVLADYSRLYLEGQAFERDSPAIIAAREQGWPLTAYLETAGREQEVGPLQIAFVANQIDREARTLHFYIDFPNSILPSPTGSDASRFVSWKYRPGQRMELAVPVEEWQDQLVLPVAAVARDGAESFVFLQSGKKFDRRPVHVKYRDQTSVVVANDGAIFPGDVIAMRGAYQLQMALKNQSGGGVDPHAGHNH